MRCTFGSSLLLAGIACAVAGCSAGSSTGVGVVVSAPAPSPPPPNPAPPASSTSVDPLASPATQEFAVFKSDADTALLRIRYNTVSQFYEVLVPGRDWTQLFDDSEQGSPPGEANQNYIFSERPYGSYFMVRTHAGHTDQKYRYLYSSLAAWSADNEAQDGSLRGHTAFGVPTPAGAVPVTGSGNYQGLVEGTSTVDSVDWDGNPTSSTIASGTVALQFDFAKGMLSGELMPVVWDDKGEVPLGPFAFADTTFGIGSSSFSGRFTTDAVGPNAFAGLFTGPNAEELIGQWSVPFLFWGVPETATGVWVAKRGQ